MGGGGGGGGGADWQRFAYNELPPRFPGNPPFPSQPNFRIWGPGVPPLKSQDIFRYLRLLSLISSHYCVVTPTSLKYLPFWAHFGISDRAVSGWFSWLFIGCSKHLWGAAFFQYGSIDAKPSTASTYTMQAIPCSQPNCAVCKPYSLIDFTQLCITQHITNTQGKQKPETLPERNITVASSHTSMEYTLYPESHTAAPIRCEQQYGHT